MKKDILKIAGVKSEKEFYKKYPTEEAFMAEHGKAFKKAMRGSKITKAQGGTNVPPNPANYPDYESYAAAMDVFMKGLGKGNTLPRTKLGNVKDIGTLPTPSATPSAIKQTTQKAGAGPAPYIQAGVDVIEGLSMIKDQRDAVRSAKQQSELSKLYEKGVAALPVQQPRRQYVRPEDAIFQPEQMFPSYGMGTNVLAQDGAMIGGNPT